MYPFVRLKCIYIKHSKLFWVLPYRFKLLTRKRAPVCCMNVSSIKVIQTGLQKIVKIVNLDLWLIICSVWIFYNLNRKLSIRTYIFTRTMFGISHLFTLALVSCNNNLIVVVIIFNILLSSQIKINSLH